MSLFLKFVGWLASKGSKYVKWAWDHKGQISEWLNIGYSFVWVYDEIKKRIG
ncbi:MULTISPECIES: aureocin A53 family class IId bacteriocin [unclassified Priestia]|uniref:aureocin A53 family class IId bacteriocin n=1 Tax=unclassified Priestia TaxID=2800374 RepID=UPI00366E7460